MLKLQNIYPFTKSQGLDECFLPFIIYIHRQCDLHLFLQSLQIKLQLRLHLLHTGVYQNRWGAVIHVRRMLSYTTFTIQMLFAVFFALCTTLQSKFEWKENERMNEILPSRWISVLTVWSFTFSAFLLRDTGSEMLDNKANASVLDTSRAFLFIFFIDWSS